MFAWVLQLISKVTGDLAAHLNDDTPHDGYVVKKSGDEMIGILVAQSNTNYSTRQVGNRILWDGTGVKPTGQPGDELITYTP
jgi:hypothetical protein